MSTTFGIYVPAAYSEDDKIEVVIAFRSSTIRWENPLAHLLPDDTKVEALDNSHQGIYTIGDIRKAIEKQNE